MTSKERMKTALSGKQPDRVPAAPDISNMVPCRLTGKPFWEIYKNGNPSLTMAYIDAVRFYDMDGWLIDNAVNMTASSHIDLKSVVTKQNSEGIEVHNAYSTPDGELSETIWYSIDNPPTYTEKMIKDFRTDYKKIRHFFSEIRSYDASPKKIIDNAYGDLGISSAMVVPPGFQTFIHYFNNNLEGCTYSYYDDSDLFLELSGMYYKQQMQCLEILIDCGYDSIMIGASGSVTLQSPDIWDELTLPFIVEATKICKQAGVISGMHSCGLQQHMIQRCAEKTDLDYVNPLEIPPMGDCNLKDIKDRYQNRISLMGNLNTTEVMLFGSYDKVYYESLKAIRDAGLNGGFVLSTGDQCGRDTPDRNIHAMIDAAKEYGTYPLDLQRINEKIGLMERGLEN